MQSENEKNIPSHSKSAQKKHYHTPKLADFGTVACLTQGTAKGNQSDRGKNMMVPS